MILVTESKRDDLLMPYYSAVKSKCPELTLGEFKKWMLKKLAAEGGINNLSLSSNYYLAGATRYYFQGELTIGGAQMLTGEPNKPDKWNVDVCRRLNVLIEILRNAYIDSVGTTFEQPEDFGTLTLPKLLRKYGKKIDAALGAESPEEKKPEDTLDRSNRVGNGYSFDILYDYEQATKYNSYTTPGAWCITYGRGHYDSYIRNLNIHYVIFRKDGFESVQRPDMPVSKQKPQDEYGNSLIAFLQSNSGPLGVYITSRWNHGYGNSSGTEADHAYSNEEFMRITGVTKKDLERIYTIWKTDYKKHTNDEYEDKTQARKEAKIKYAGILRKFKYAQMLINGGESIKGAFELAGFKFDRSQIIYGGGQPATEWKSDDASMKKYVVGYELIYDNDDNITKILADKNKLLFETIPIPGKEDEMTYQPAEIVFRCENNAFPGVIVIGCDNNYKLYSARYHEFINIGGVTKFKKVPTTRDQNGGGYTSPLYAEIKNGMKDVALLSAATGRPVKFPNGQFWANDILCDENRHWERGGEIHCHILDSRKVGPVAEILYDESSREKYFLNLHTGKFLDWMRGLSNLGLGEPTISCNSVIGTKNIFGVTFIPPNRDTRWRTNYSSIRLYTVDGKPFSIYGKNNFEEINSYCGGRFLVYKDPDDYQNEREDRRSWNYHYYYPKRIFDIETQRVIAVGDKPILVSQVYLSDRFGYDSYEGEPRILYASPSSRDIDSDTCYIYDINKGLLFKNDVQPSDVSYGGIVFKLKNTGSQSYIQFYIDDYKSWKTYQELSNLSQVILDRRYGTTDPWEAEQIEEKKHVRTVQFDELGYIPNNLPINNSEPTESSAEEAQPAMAASLSESDIKYMTKMVINEIRKRLK